MGLIRDSCGHISGPQEPISTKFGLWRFSSCSADMWYSKRWNAKRQQSFLRRHSFGTLLPSWVLWSLLFCDKTIRHVRRASKWFILAWNKEQNLEFINLKHVTYAQPIWVALGCICHRGCRDFSVDYPRLSKVQLCWRPVQFIEIAYWKIVFFNQNKN